MLKSLIAGTRENRVRTIVGILTFISMINYRLNPESLLYLGYFNI